MWTVAIAAAVLIADRAAAEWRAWRAEFLIAYREQRLKDQLTIAADQAERLWAAGVGSEYELEFRPPPRDEIRGAIEPLPPWQARALMVVIGLALGFTWVVWTW